MAAKKPKDTKPKPPKDAGEGKPKPGKGGGGCGPLAWLCMLVVLALLYVLSVFPMVWAINRNYLAPGLVPTIKFVYAPLAYANRHVPWVKQFYDWGFATLGLH